jgi:ABC-type polysaccharide/polyol phosphate export permease
VITEIVKSTFTNRYLIGQLAKREIIGRYRGTSLGLAWSLINPLLMLGVYTFVFGIVFQARWGVTSSDSKLEFALVLFAGLIINNLFAECVNRAPMLVVLNANYVKKIVFPLEILPIVSACSALFHAAISTLVLVLAQLILKQSLPWTIILIPAADRALGDRDHGPVLAACIAWGIFARHSSPDGARHDSLAFYVSCILSHFGFAAPAPTVAARESTHLFS